MGLRNVKTFLKQYEIMTDCVNKPAKTYLLWDLLGYTVTFLFRLLIANFFGM